MQKTIGGNRIGSGRKMNVELRNYERSTHNLGYIWRSSMSSGTLVPFLKKVALPGDTFDIDLEVDIKTHPTVGPLFGSYKIQLDVFQCPIRLYHSALHNNMLGIGMNMNRVILPKLTLKGKDAAGLTEDNINTSQINPSCIFNYLGIKGVGIGTENRSFNAIPYLAYWDIYKNYYANKQEEIGMVIHTPDLTVIETVTSTKIVDNTNTETTLPESPSVNSITMVAGNRIRLYYTGTQPIPEQIIISTNEHGDLSALALCGGFTNYTTYLEGAFNQTKWGVTTATKWRYTSIDDISDGKPKVTQFDLANIDSMRTQILATSIEDYVNIDQYSLEPYNLPLTQVSETVKVSMMNSQEGLGLKTYQSDQFNNWLSTEWIDGSNGINAITAIDTTDGSFTLDTLNLSKKVYDMLNRIAISGGTYDDWLDAVYTHDRYTKAESPMYMGGLSKELVFQEIVSNSQTDGQPLGTLAGKGHTMKNQKGGHVIIKIDEPSYIIGLISLTPRIDYSQGNDFDIHLNTMDDLHKPALDEIGFQELITERMAWWDTKYNTTTSKWETRSAGKQPAWIDYMTSVNENHGNFAIADNEMFMTLNRRYEYDQAKGIKDLTTYIDPSKFNFIFADTALDSQNFWAQIGVDITARRKMSAKIMPNL